MVLFTRACLALRVLVWKIRKSHWQKAASARTLLWHASKVQSNLTAFSGVAEVLNHRACPHVPIATKWHQKIMSPDNSSHLHSRTLQQFTQALHVLRNSEMCCSSIRQLYQTPTTGLEYQQRTASTRQCSESKP